MDRIWLTGIIGALLVPSLLFAACGDDDSESTPTAAPTTATTAATSPTARPSSTTSGGGGSELADLLDKLGDATYRVEYDIAGNVAGNVTGKGILAGRPPSRLFDFQGRTSLGINRFVVIETGTNNYLCLDTQGQKNCAKDEAATGLPLPSGLSVDEIFSSIAVDPATSAEETDGREIAGVESRCFNVTGLSSSGLLCATDAGVPMLFDGKFNGATWKITATKAGDPTDADFEPPFEVVG